MLEAVLLVPQSIASSRKTALPLFNQLLILSRNSIGPTLFRCWRLLLVLDLAFDDDAASLPCCETGISLGVLSPLRGLGLYRLTLMLRDLISTYCLVKLIANSIRRNMYVILLLLREVLRVHSLSGRVDKHPR